MFVLAQDLQNQIPCPCFTGGRLPGGLRPDGSVFGIEVFERPECEGLRHGG